MKIAAIKERQKILLKDILFNQKSINHLSCLLKKAHPKFNKQKFERHVIAKFPDLELKERISWIRHNLESNLPNNYPEALAILLRSIKDQTEKDDFIFSVFPDFIAVNGCSSEHIDTSLSALSEFTKYASAEFSIRVFINAFPNKTFQQMKKWSLSDNIFQRRLASEGLRPKLPWAQAISFDYKKSAEILDNLFYDNERYVTRSVANHLNDISKFDPDFVLMKLKQWRRSKKQDSIEMNYIIHHSLRTCIKKGHAKTFNFLGHRTNPNVVVKKFNIRNKSLRLNDYLEFSFDIISKNKEKLIIDYKLTYPNPRNKLSQKVFKLKKTILKSNEKITIQKKHLFREMTTKKLYPGVYLLDIQVNGKVMFTDRFNLIT